MSDWRDYANCRGTDPEAYFPDEGESSRLARQVCARCVVRLECLDWAVQRRIRVGVWGGLTAKQRRPLHRGAPLVPRGRCGRGHNQLDPRNVRVARDGTRRCAVCENAARRQGRAA